MVDVCLEERGEDLKIKGGDKAGTEREGGGVEGDGENIK